MNLLEKAISIAVKAHAGQTDKSGATYILHPLRLMCRMETDSEIRHELPHGGWCPRGRKAEDGVIGGQYQVAETPSEDHSQRTEWNVRDSDGTVVFTLAPNAAGGPLLTIELAKKLGKPCLHLSRSGDTYDERALLLQRFVDENRIAVVNVAGSRESEEPGVYLWVASVIEDAFFWRENHPGMIGGPGEG